MVAAPYKFHLCSTPIPLFLLGQPVALLCVVAVCSARGNVLGEAVGVTLNVTGYLVVFVREFAR